MLDLSSKVFLLKSVNNFSSSSLPAPHFKIVKVTFRKNLMISHWCHWQLSGTCVCVVDILFVSTHNRSYFQSLFSNSVWFGSSAVFLRAPTLETHTCIRACCIGPPVPGLLIYQVHSGLQRHFDPWTVGVWLMLETVGIEPKHVMR